MTTSSHSWKFFRAGGVDQVVLATAADLANLRTLDQKLWVALACPVDGMSIEPRTLKLLDADGDGRIHPPDVLATVDWLEAVMKDLDDLFRPAAEVPLASISSETALGKEVLAGAKLILRNLGKADASAITLADVSSTELIFSATKLNGDGIVPADSTDDEETSKAIADVLAIMGGTTDRSGKPGVDQARVDGFFEQARVYAEWARDGAAVSRVLGDATSAAADAFGAVRAKVDDYFARCRLAAFDGRAAVALNAQDSELVALSAQVLTAGSDEVAKLPLARVEGGRPLPLVDGLNPAWSARIAAFASAAVLPVLPVLGGVRGSLTEREWEAVTAKLAPYEAWIQAKPRTDVVTLGHDRVMALAGSGARTRVTDLIAKDAALAGESGQIEAVEKLVRCRRDFVALLENFVSFAAFYRRRKGAFQVGTLYLDGRSCDLCLPVVDAGKHATLAPLSQAYLAYCDCVRVSGAGADKEKRTIVAAVTAGDTDNLMVGRNGVFYDLAGHDWDATVTKIVENPLSVRQAFWSPYKRFVRLIQEQIAKRAKAADEASNKKLEGAAVETASADKAADAAKDAGAKSAAKTEEKGIDIGTVAAIGVAVGGIATFFSSIVATFLGLGMWMPLGVVALVLAISGPSMIIAWLKLRQRNIGPLLDANGWAVNALTRINVPFGAALTKVARLPPGASHSLVDPFAEKKRPWGLYVFLLVLAALGAAWAMGRFDAYLPDRARAETVLHPGR